MYAKIESERLRLNQAKLRAEEYLHLRDGINNNIDSNLDINNIGQAYILYHHRIQAAQGICRNTFKMQ